VIEIIPINTLLPDTKKHTAKTLVLTLKNMAANIVITILVAKIA
jgi:hypothetical protein